MATNPNHRYAILERGSRLLETTQSEERAIARANVHSYRTGHGVSVIDRHNPIVRETSSIFGGTRATEAPRTIYETMAVSAGSPRR